MEEGRRSAGQAPERAPAAEAPDAAEADRGASERMTCSVEEFARIVGIGYNRALDLCASRDRPPGFRSGRRYLVIKAELPGWLREMSERGAVI